MDSEKKIYCPKCDSPHTDLISYVYQCLESENAGKKLFVDGFDTELNKKRELSAENREKLFTLIKPPQEAKVSFPAATVAMMAFFVSWLVVGSILISKIGERIYFYLTISFIVILAYPFYSTMDMIIKQVHKNYLRYKDLKNIWVKKRYCYDCGIIFILEPKPTTPAKKKRSP
jgi:hypothetical protein